MNFSQTLQRLGAALSIFLVFVASAAIVPERNASDIGTRYSLADVQKIYAEAKALQLMADGSLAVTDKTGKNIGYLLSSADFNVKHTGYGGEVPVLIAFNESKIITGVYLLRNNEEDDFIGKVIDAKLLDRWNSKPMKAFVANQDVDAVTGATFSSNAIINTVRHTIAAYLKTAAPTIVGKTTEGKTATSTTFVPAPLTAEVKEKKSVGVRPYIMPKPALVIGSYSRTGEPDIMAAAWAGIANSNPLCIAVSIQQSRKTYENIKATGYFTVNVPSAQYAAQMDYVGVVSGRQENKFKSLGLTPVKGQYVNAPYIGEFPIVIECQVIDTLYLGSHTQFIGKVLDTKVDVDLLDANNRVNSVKMEPVIFDDNGYFTYGRYLGKPFDMYKTLKSNATTTNKTNSEQNSTLETIFKRKSVRRYTNRAVSKEQLTLLVKAGMAAPSAVDKRPWVFVAITDRAMLDKLADMLPHAKMLKQSTAAIVVCGDMNRALEGDAKSYWIQDCSAATENILLAAESIGLGAVWTGVHPSKDREKVVTDALGLPNNILPLNVIAIGYPLGNEQPKDKWNEQLLHWDKW